MLLPIFYSFALFLFLFVLHIIISHLNQKIKEDKLLVLLFIGLPCALAPMGLFFFSHSISLEMIFSTLSLYLLIASSYIGSYPAVYSTAPTLVIVLLIYKNRKTGMTVQELVDLMELKKNSVDRIEDALHSGLIQKENDKLVLSGFGKMIYSFFWFYKTVIGREKTVL